jgi:hypothetical protein
VSSKQFTKNLVSVLTTLFSRFQLPGGPLKLTDDEEINLPVIDGELQAWGNLTSTLADTLGKLKADFKRI